MWLAHCKHRSDCLHSIWAYRYDIGTYMCQNTTNSNIYFTSKLPYVSHKQICLPHSRGIYGACIFIYMSYIKSLPSTILSRTTNTYLATYFLLLSYITEKYGYHIVYVGHTTSLLYGHKDKTLVHICVKIQPTATSTSHYIDIYAPETNMWTRLHMYTKYLKCIYGRCMCIHICHIWNHWNQPCDCYVTHLWYSLVGTNISEIQNSPWVPLSMTGFSLILSTDNKSTIYLILLFIYNPNLNHTNFNLKLTLNSIFLVFWNLLFSGVFLLCLLFSFFFSSRSISPTCSIHSNVAAYRELWESLSEKSLSYLSPVAAFYLQPIKAGLWRGLLLPADRNCTSL